MGLDSAEAPKANGFKTVLDTIIAPKEALESLRTTPTWGWAFVTTVILSAIATFLFTPALQHAMAASWPATIANNPNLAAMTAAQQQRALAMTQTVIGFSWAFVIITIPIGLLIQTVILTIFNALGRGEGSFGKYWAVACNVAVPAIALGYVVAAIVMIVRGTDSFDTMKAVQTAAPSLAMLAPDAGPKLTAFLSVITPFTIWGALLIVAAMRIVGRVPRLHAWLAAIASMLVPALLAKVKHSSA